MARPGDEERHSSKEREKDESEKENAPKALKQGIRARLFKQPRLYVPAK